MSRRSKRTSAPTAATMGQVPSAYRGQHTQAHFAEMNPRNHAGFNDKRKADKKAKRAAKRRKKALKPSSSDYDSSESESSSDDDADWEPTFQGYPSSENKLEMVHDLMNHEFGGHNAFHLTKMSIDELNDLYAQQYKKWLNDEL